MLTLRQHRTISWRLVELLAGGAVVLGSLALVAIPIATLWLVPRLAPDPLAAYVVALVACPLAVIGWGMVLVWLDRGLRGMQGEPGRGSLLDASVTAAVVIALVALLLWYLFVGATGPAPRVVI
jgi:hypothetical protein